MRILAASVVLVAAIAIGAPPRDAVPIDAAELPMNYRLHIGFSEPTGGAVRLAKDLLVPLANSVDYDIAVEHSAKGAPVLRVWSGGKLMRGPEEMPGLSQNGAQDFSDAKLDLGADFTAAVKFESGGSGTLFSKCAAKGKWSPDSKALFIRGGRLVYDIGWLGAMTGGPKVDDGRPHTAALAVRDGAARLWLDGKVVAENAKFMKPDVTGHVFKIGRAADNFAGDFTKGKIASVRVWSRVLPDAEMALLFKGDGAGANTPDFTHTPAGGGGRPVIEPAAGVTVRAAWVQALERSDHADIVGGWNDKTLAEGAEIYKTLRVVCHGTKEQPGALTVTFSEPLDPASVKPDAFAFKVWSLKRSANYGSKHYDEHALEIAAARLSSDARTVTLGIPALAPTQCYELKLTLRAPGGVTVERSLHGTIHRLSEQ